MGKDKRTSDKWVTRNRTSGKFTTRDEAGRSVSVKIAKPAVRPKKVTVDKIRRAVAVVTTKPQ